MKRSKIFLAITTALLAIAAVAATKAHMNANTLQGYFTSKNLLCTAQGERCYTVGSKDPSARICLYNVDGIVHKIYTVRREGPCRGKVLYTEAAD